MYGGAFAGCQLFNNGFGYFYAGIVALLENDGVEFNFVCHSAVVEGSNILRISMPEGG